MTDAYVQKLADRLGLCDPEWPEELRVLWNNCVLDLRLSVERLEDEKRRIRAGWARVSPLDCKSSAYGCERANSFPAHQF